MKFSQLPEETIKQLDSLVAERDNLDEQIRLIYEIEHHDHVDTFIDSGTMDYDKYGDDAHVREQYARWFLNHSRLPATQKYAFDQFMKDKKLFCTWNGRRMRVTGSSRLGDVWLTRDFKQSSGYQERVDVSECSEWNQWSKRP